MRGGQRSATDTTKQEQWTQGRRGLGWERPRGLRREWGGSGGKTKSRADCADTWTKHQRLPQGHTIMERGQDRLPYPPAQPAGRVPDAPGPMTQEGHIPARGTGPGPALAPLLAAESGYPAW